MIYNDIDLIAKIRKTLRITSTAYDDEIFMLIDMCVNDLISSGAVLETDNTNDNYYANDSYIVSIIIIYVKAYFGIENSSQDWFVEQYLRLKAELLNKAEYIIGDDSDDI